MRKRKTKDKKNCAKCSSEFETDENFKSSVCQKCDKEMKDEAQVFQIFKWICFSCALAVFSMFIPILAAKETSSGYYSIQGKGRPLTVSRDGMTKWKIAIPIIAAGFSFAGFLLKQKEDKKKSEYESFQTEEAIFKRE